MQPGDLTLPTSRDIQLDLISMTEWRVRDRRFQDTDSRAVLGFIERRGFVYEVTTIADPTRVTRCGSLASATNSFATPEGRQLGAAE